MERGDEMEERGDEREKKESYGDDSPGIFLPPLMNNIILVFLTSQVNVRLIFELDDDDEYPILKLLFLLLAILMLFLFLLTSITIHLRFTAHPITVRSGYFSAPLTFSLLVSILLPPPLFWVSYFIIIISCPFHGMIWNMLKFVFNWFVINLRSCSTLLITCSTTQQQEATLAGGLSVEFIDIEGNPLQN
ncbi:hypothetical protein Pint_22396 [Pistacia integerrima]|uniref:Uncharacterized protein n=1 Tax=Pistacia integerrima TaxID=434235 RepID=A0ACC0YKB9_9ROSI|nr:hypothetical protein Pint_22396 [Pistacia integerrima]